MRLSGKKIARLAPSWTPPRQAILLSLIGIQAVAFIIQCALGLWNPAFSGEYLGLSRQGIDQAFGWQFFSALFLHASIWHFMANLLFLYAMGRDIEAILGQKQFLFLYLFGAFAGELGHLFLMPAETVLFAATGGVAAVSAAYAVMLPSLDHTVSLFYLIPIRLTARTIMRIALLVAAALFLFDRGGAVGHSAFFGGAAAGWLYAHLLGYGRPSLIRRHLNRRAMARRRLELKGASQFLREEIDPLLEKVATRGIASLSRRDRRLLAQARQKFITKRGL